MTFLEAKELVGKEVIFLDRFTNRDNTEQIEKNRAVVILDVKTSYGKTRFLIDVGGRRKWVNEDRIKI